MCLRVSWCPKTEMQARVRCTTPTSMHLTLNSSPLAVPRGSLWSREERMLKGKWERGGAEKALLLPAWSRSSAMGGKGGIRTF